MAGDVARGPFQICRARRIGNAPRSPTLSHISRCHHPVLPLGLEPCLRVRGDVHNCKQAFIQLESIHNSLRGSIRSSGNLQSYAPLFPRTNASPYVRRSLPSTSSCVCSSAMFMYPSTDWSSPGNHKQRRSVSTEFGMGNLR